MTNEDSKKEAYMRLLHSFVLENSECKGNIYIKSRKVLQNIINNAIFVQ